MVEHARRLGGFNGGVRWEKPPVIGVVVNTVATARRVFDRLREANSDEPEHDTILLTGRIRPYDRDRLLSEWLPRIKAGRQIQPERPLFVVATQTVEVGANLDFNALVTEAAPLDSLRQRFGRLDRLGERQVLNLPSPAAIVIRSDRSKNSELDPIYGSSIAETWKWLSGKGVRDKTKRVNFGVSHLDSKLRKVKVTDLRRMLAPQPDPPLMFPAHLNAWVQTNPKPEPDPDVAPFLHGSASDPADVQIIWRADLNEQNESSWKGIVRLMPPRTREALAVPIFEAQHWLRDDALGDIADLEGLDFDRTVYQNKQKRSRTVLRWRGPKDRGTSLVSSDEVRPGDTIVVPASYGGSDGFGWNPSLRAPAVDVAEACLSQQIASYPANAFRRPALRFRLHSALLEGPDATAKNRFAELLNTVIAATKLEESNASSPVLKVLRTLKEWENEPAKRGAIDAFIEAIDANRPPRIQVYPDHSGVVLIAFLTVSLPDEQAAPQEEFEDEEPADEESSVAPKGQPITLSKHTEAVERMSVHFAEKCGLSQFSEVLRLAAQWHDEGKRDRRFQAWLHGSEIAALAADEPLAKSGRDSNDWGASDAFGYPRGARHEFVSVRLFEKAGHPSVGDADLDLVRLLVGTHHGNGRAFATIANDPSPVVVTRSRTIAVCSDHRLYRLDSGWTDLFWRMVRRYGWWGLSYLEAVLITADRLVSAQEQASGQKAANSG